MDEQAPISLASLKTIMEEVFIEHSHIGSQAHGEHHAWIEERLAAEKAKKDLYWEITKSVAQWSVVGLLSYCVYWLKDHFH